MRRSLLFSYTGSKAILSQWHVTLFPKTKYYVSVFGGTGSEFLWREPHGIEVFNDLDNDIYNAFSVIRDRKKCAELKRLLLATPDGRQQFLACQEAMDDPDPVRRAWAFFVVANSEDILTPIRQRVWASSQQRLYWLPEYLDWWRDRFRHVKLECRPCWALIEKYDRENSLLYCDPPYHPLSLGIPNDRFYRHTMSSEEHVNLLLRLTRCKAKVILCGYPTPTYDCLLSHWVRLERKVQRRVGERKHRTEAVWLNFDPPTTEDTEVA